MRLYFHRAIFIIVFRVAGRFIIFARRAVAALDSSFRLERREIDSPNDRVGENYTIDHINIKNISQTLTCITENIVSIANIFVYYYRSGLHNCVLYNCAREHIRD